MDLHKKIKEINNRWAIPDDESYEEKFRKFKTRILNFFSDIDIHLLESSISLFCNAMGIQEVWTRNRIYNSKWSKNIINALIVEDDPKKFFRLLEVIFALEFKNTYELGRISRDKLIQKTKQAFTFSNIGVNMVIRDDDVIFYPSGEKLLDDETVNKVLSFLSNQSLQHFLDALKYYEQNTKDSSVKSAESLRRTLEEFLRLKLGNEKGLKQNISELGKRLKLIKVNDDIKNIVTTILSSLDNPFFNNNSKHKDGNIDESENEFLIYQIALLMRYIEKIIEK